jgi:hypothetical protein
MQMTPHTPINSSMTPIAVLIDGDNIGALHADQILDAAKRIGRVDITPVYTDTNHQPNWQKKAGFG